MENNNSKPKNITRSKMFLPMFEIYGTLYYNSNTNIRIKSGDLTISAHFS